jgi:hypothetical protein
MADRDFKLVVRDTSGGRVFWLLHVHTNIKCKIRDESREKTRERLLYRIADEAPGWTPPEHA